MISDAIIAALGPYLDAVRAKHRLELEREEMEAAIAQSLIGTPNADTGKPHSRTSAEAFAKSCADVLALRYQLIDAECRILETRARYEAAQIDAREALARLEVAA